MLQDDSGNYFAAGLGTAASVYVRAAEAGIRAVEVLLAAALFVALALAVAGFEVVRGLGRIVKALDAYEGARLAAAILRSETLSLRYFNGIL